MYKLNIITIANIQSFLSFCRVQKYLLYVFSGPKSYHCLPLSATNLLTHSLMLLRLTWCYIGVWWCQHWNRYRDFSSDTKFSEIEPFFFNSKFSETETDTFFPITNFSKPKPKSSKIWQKSWGRDQNRDFSTFFTYFTIFWQVHN